MKTKRFRILRMLILVLDRKKIYNSGAVEDIVRCFVRVAYLALGAKNIFFK